MARHRPRSSLVLGIQQENRQIRQLQLENKGRCSSSVAVDDDLWSYGVSNCRAEDVIRGAPISTRAHYDQVQGAGFQAPHGQQKGRPCHCEPAQGAAHHRQWDTPSLPALNVEAFFLVYDISSHIILQEMQAHIDKINEMASVMKKAIEVDEGRLCEDEERIKQLEVKANGHFGI